MPKEIIMTSRDFAYWLQGFFELSDSETLTENQVKHIKTHLHMVFRYDIDPSFGIHSDDLSEIHNGPQKPETVIFKPDRDTRLRC